MKIPATLNIILLVTLNYFLSVAYGQSAELPKKGEEGKKDTIFFKPDPAFKDYLIEWEELPLFPGGEKAMISYISENTIYPKAAIDDCISGQVILSFVVGENGNTSIGKFYKSLSADIDGECIRVIKEMPQWKPGSNVFSSPKGLYRKNVPVYYMISLNFILNNEIPDKGITIRPR